ncbi:hypothetical protein H206_03105 [Candidatus Electrothrix aarhusensis]|uniref:DUF6680 domain-containing protein n=1 Tax=Candidatus Electrothrix aarhusensis TaxID=1859131 RepID=A0A3S3QGN1_9BACT|nr:hypothetical protein H206_03105 [Candidatus Electrothrix aarhusensis]
MEIIAILLSPLIAVIVSKYISYEIQKRNDKLDLFKTLMATRENPATMEYTNAVNSIDIIFYQNNDILTAWKNLYNEYSSKDPNYNLIIQYRTKLLEEMAKELGYKDKITWEHITTPYVPNWLVKTREEEAEYKHHQLILMRSAAKNITKDQEQKDNLENPPSN